MGQYRSIMVIDLFFHRKHNSSMSVQQYTLQDCSATNNREQGQNCWNCLFSGASETALHLLYLESTSHARTGCTAQVDDDQITHLICVRPICCCMTLLGRGWGSACRRVIFCTTLLPFGELVSVPPFFKISFLLQPQANQELETVPPESSFLYHFWGHFLPPKWYNF